MKKKFTRISVILLILLAFTACSNDNNPAQIYIDYQEFTSKSPYIDMLTAEAMPEIGSKEVILTKDNYEQIFNTNYTSDNEYYSTLQYYITNIENLNLQNTTFSITDVSGIYKYKSAEDNSVENTIQYNRKIEFDNIVVKYTLKRDGENEKPQEFQVSFSYKNDFVRTRTTDSEISSTYKTEYLYTTTYSINGVNKGTIERKASSSSASAYSVTSFVFNGTDITRYYNTINNIYS